LAGVNDRAHPLCRGTNKQGDSLLPKTKIRVRFAPSPTGSLHVGNARTALYNWLFAQQNKGSFILRIEDTDQERTLPIYTQSLLADLRWLGIMWDEGPLVGGAYGPYHQFERLEIYQRYLQVLIAKGLVYRCYCTEEELEAERSLLIATHQPPRYSGKCRNLTSAQQRDREAQGRQAAWRFSVGSGEIAFTDLIRGKISFWAQSIGDFIIMRANGTPAYNFAVVVDDALMEISHIIRGEDHLSNTALQLLLYRELGFTPPLFAHHSLILGKDRTKLSKRHGAAAIDEFRRLGFLPEALLNYLAICGMTLGSPQGKTAAPKTEMGQDIYSRTAMIELFGLEKMGKAGAIFDVDKLRWLNAQYLRHLEDAELAKRLEPLAMEIIGKPLPPQWLERFCGAFKENFVLLSDAREYLLFFSDEAFSIEPAAREVLGSAETQLLLGVLHLILESEPAGISYENLIAKMKKASAARGRALFIPIRAALTGKLEGIELNKLFALLPPKSLLFRLHKAML